MDGMKIVGDCRRRQDVPAAGRERARDEAVALNPSWKPKGRGGQSRGCGEPGTESNGLVLLATVKGDVYDIGKNIVGVVP
jgi:cobalamin-dependent methionine synthase I